MPARKLDHRGLRFQFFQANSTLRDPAIGSPDERQLVDHVLPGEVPLRNALIKLGESLEIFRSEFTIQDVDHLDASRRARPCRDIHPPQLLDEGQGSHPVTKVGKVLLGAWRCKSHQHLPVSLQGLEGAEVADQKSHRSPTCCNCIIRHYYCQWCWYHYRCRPDSGVAVS